MSRISFMINNINQEKIDLCNTTQRIKNKDLKAKKSLNFLSRKDKNGYFGGNEKLNNQVVHVNCNDKESKNKVYIINYNKK